MKKGEVATSPSSLITLQLYRFHTQNDAAHAMGKRSHCSGAKHFGSNVIGTVSARDQQAAQNGTKKNRYQAKPGSDSHYTYRNRRHQ